MQDAQRRRDPRSRRPAVPADPELASSRRLNALARGTGALRYLEIGVLFGKTFLNVELPEKDAVDPEFQFDVASQTTGNIRFHAMESDHFFASCPLDFVYDLVFIDGLHLFEQAYRDLCNAMIHLRRGGVILLDDTVPSDHFSAWRDGNAAVAARRATGSDDGSWHGDVFKVVFAIHDFHPSLNYVTIGTGGNPQTLIWQSRNFPRQPLFNTFTAIEALDYNDLQSRLELLRILPEDEAIAFCLEDLALSGGFSPVC